MPQIVEPHVWQSGQFESLLKSVRDSRPVEGRSYCRGEDEISLLPFGTGYCTFLILMRAVDEQSRYTDFGQRDRTPVSASFRLRQFEFSAYPLERVM